jgi:hypothetical protein
LERLEKELKQRFGDLAPDNAADEIVEESGGNAVADKLVSDNEEDSIGSLASRNLARPSRFFGSKDQQHNEL